MHMEDCSRLFEGVVHEGNPDQGHSDARVPTRLKVDSKELRSVVLTGLYFM